LLSLLLSSRLSDVSSRFCCAEPEVACSRFDAEKTEEEACAGANPASAIRATAADSSIAFATFLEFIEPNISNQPMSGGILCQAFELLSANARQHPYP